MDVKSAFLNAILHEKAYVEQPKGFKDPHFSNHVYKLNKALYELKQAPWAWYERLTNFLIEKSYKRGGVDKKLFIMHFNTDIIFTQIYIDDIVFSSTSSSKVQEFQMREEFDMSMVGELNFFLCLQVKQIESRIFIAQSKYAKNLVKRFGLEKAKHFNTQMSTTLKLSKDEIRVSVDPTLYRSMIDSLLYLTASCPNICYSVGVCARYQSHPKESHIKQLRESLDMLVELLIMEFGILKILI